MNRFGCSSQGFIFPQAVVPPLLNHTDVTTDWLIDMMIEQISDKQDWHRWATVLVLLQHIGTTRSKGSGFNNITKDLRTGGFELWERNMRLPLSSYSGLENTKSAFPTW